MNPTRQERIIHTVARRARRVQDLERNIEELGLLEFELAEKFGMRRALKALIRAHEGQIRTYDTTIKHLSQEEDHVD